MKLSFNSKSGGGGRPRFFFVDHPSQPLPKAPNLEGRVDKKNKNWVDPPSQPFPHAPNLEGVEKNRIHLLLVDPPSQPLPKAPNLEGGSTNLFVVFVFWSTLLPGLCQRLPICCTLWTPFIRGVCSFRKTASLSFFYRSSFYFCTRCYIMFFVFRLRSAKKELLILLSNCCI